MKFAISACLMGINCKYNGGNNFNQELFDYMQNHEYILICPETSGGMSVPRTPSECVNDKVINQSGEDVTHYFHLGAEVEINRIKTAKIEHVICQSRSPSCGKDVIYDGTFSKRLITGNGVFVQKCIENGIDVIDIQSFLMKTVKKNKKNDDN